MGKDTRSKGVCKSTKVVIDKRKTFHYVKRSKTNGFCRNKIDIRSPYKINW